MKQKRSAWMRTPRKGRWLLAQPRSGARVRQAGLFVLHTGVQRKMSAKADGRPARRVGEVTSPTRLHRPTQRNMPLKRRVGCAASRENSYRLAQNLHNIYHVLSESLLHLPLWMIFRHMHLNSINVRSTYALSIYVHLTKYHLTNSGTERLREYITQERRFL